MVRVRMRDPKSCSRMERVAPWGTRVEWVRSQAFEGKECRPPFAVAAICGPASGVDMKVTGEIERPLIHATGWADLQDLPWERSRRETQASRPAEPSRR
jgi:hypothetical protein